MVADKVTLLTRRAGESRGTRWESDGEGTYTIETVDDAPQGTAVTVHLKPEDRRTSLFDYTAEWKIREIVKRYSDFIAWPIRMDVERPPVSGARTEATTSEASDDASTVDDEPLNSMKALWARPQSEVDRGRVQRVLPAHQPRLDRPARDHPHEGRGHLRVRGAAVHPVPARRSTCSRRDAKRGVQLYVKRVFIMDDCEALMPDYLRFVKGVVDAHDLSLNISREILQQDRQIQLMRRRLVKKVLSTVKDLMAERRRRATAPSGRSSAAAVKEGLLDDVDNQEAILDIVLVRLDPRRRAGDHPARVRRADEGRPGTTSTT